MSFSRLVRATSALAAGAMLLTGCVLFPDLGTPVAQRPGPTGEEVAADLARFYTQELDWERCNGRSVDCTEVTVPLDWSDPAGETIHIAIARHRASGKPLGSLLFNPGGPGGSGFDFIYDYAEYAVSEGVLDNFDIIGFDPRGVGRSTPVTCFTDAEDQDERLYGTYEADYGTLGWLEELTEREQEWVDACVAGTGALLGHLDAASVARDMDVMRAVLGDDTLNYLGFSYGTYLGTMYAELFPEKVGRMVLDGAVDPLVGDLESLEFQMAGFDSALRAYLEWCLAATGCPFSGTTDRAMSMVRSALDTVDARGLVSSDGRELDSATLATGIISNLYSEGSWPSMTSMFTQLRRGDADEVFEAADAYNNRNADGSYSDNGSDVYTAVICNEGDLADDGVTTIEGIERIEKAAPVLGRHAAYDDYASLDVACSLWPAPRATLPTEFDAAGAPPIMVIGTTNDPATPYANAVSLAAQLSSGFLVTYEGEGHTIYGAGVRCIDDAVEAYLLKGVVPSADPTC